MGKNKEEKKEPVDIEFRRKIEDIIELSKDPYFSGFDCVIQIRSALHARKGILADKCRIKNERNIILKREAERCKA